tara:strand:- start:191 stop:583 length:393 start_codon:yes stop_codon:yes gene_type:complete
MYEIIIQICFVVSGVVAGCTDGFITTNDPHLLEKDLSPVYIYDAPETVTRHYHTPGYQVVIPPYINHRIKVEPHRHHHYMRPEAAPPPRAKHHKKLKVAIPPDLYRAKKHKKPKARKRFKPRHKKRHHRR